VGIVNGTVVDVVGFILGIDDAGAVDKIGFIPVPVSFVFAVAVIVAFGIFIFLTLALALAFVISFNDSNAVSPSLLAVTSKKNNPMITRIRKRVKNKLILFDIVLLLLYQKIFILFYYIFTFFSFLFSFSFS
jgi:hypothetical protein